MARIACLLTKVKQVKAQNVEINMILVKKIDEIQDLVHVLQAEEIVQEVVQEANAGREEI